MTRRHACGPATRQAVRGDRAQHRIAAQHTAAERAHSATTTSNDPKEIQP